MTIKATFLKGANTITVNGLYQWDYGRVLEIECEDIGSEIAEVHFACHNMSVAVVRSCTFADGVGSVKIPDTCLEQTTPITAWIYRINGTEGHTFKTINLPVIARTRPAMGKDIPQEISNKYTELLTEVNEAVDALENGNVTAKRATNAENADYATTAGNASSAGYATSAGSANTAGRAETAGSATTINKYLHNVQCKEAAGTSGLKCVFTFQIVTGTPSPITFSELQSLLVSNGFTTKDKLLPCSGYVYVTSNNIFYIVGGLCVDTNLQLLVHGLDGTSQYLKGDASTFEVSSDVVILL